jgi:altronate dehydratase
MESLVGRAEERLRFWSEHVCIIRTADGELTAAELLGHREFSLTRLYESA